MTTVRNWETMLFSDDEATRERQAKEFAVHCVPHFADANTEDDLYVSVLSGGITNQLLRVRRHSTGRSVVVRIYGLHTDRIISRAAEFFWQGMFVPTYGRCANGMVYEFLDDTIPLSPEDCRRHIDGIARALAVLHKSAAAKSMFRIPYATQSLHVHVALTEWPLLGTSDEAVTRIRTRSVSSAAALESYGSLESFRATAIDVWHRVEAHLSYLPIVPCHNDLLAFNILVKDKEINIIDFEYMRRNVYLFDIANHLVEWAGFECCWDNLPTADETTRFLTEYFLEAFDCGAGVSEEVLAAVGVAKALLPMLMVAAHMSWAAWSLVQGAFSAISFDYVTYGAAKYQRALLELPAAAAFLDAFHNKKNTGVVKQHH